MSLMIIMKKFSTLLRFENSLNSDSISLDSYVEKMALDQKEIYYFANTDKEYIKKLSSIRVVYSIKKFQYCL